jgi:hypothetical protein
MQWRAQGTTKSKVAIDGSISVGDRVKMTPEGGIAVKLTNKTGVNSVKGSVISASTTNDNAFHLQSSEYDSFGIVYEDGIADGSECWVVISGRCQVLLKDTVGTSRASLMIAADTDGRADVLSTPPPPPTTDTHFKEIGHCIEAKTGGTNVLAYCIIHFN